jgi:glycosyltransferase involved in cell wall biosynthesis
VVPVEERGYGAAVIGGIAAAGGHFVIMGDADNTYDFEHLEPFLDQLHAGCDLVIGNRFRGTNWVCTEARNHPRCLLSGARRTRLVDLGPSIIIRIVE